MPADGHEEDSKSVDAKVGTAQSEEIRQDAGAAVGGVDASLATDGSSAPKATSFTETPAGAPSHDRSPQPEAGAPSDKVAVLGHAVWLMSHSPLHKYVFLADLEWMLVPPVAQQQFRLWMGQGKPEAFATWALVDDAVEARLKLGHKRLAPNEWTSGPNLWLMDLVTPFGGIDDALTDLKAALQGRSIKTLRFNTETQTMEVVGL